MAIRHVGASSTRALLANLRRPQTDGVAPLAPMPSAIAPRHDEASALPAEPAITPDADDGRQMADPARAAADDPAPPDDDLAPPDPENSASIERMTADFSHATDGGALPADHVPPVDYHSIIAAAVAGLAKNTVQSRHEIYDRAHQIVRARLSEIGVPAGSFEIAREELMLDRVIAEIEAEYLANIPQSIPMPEPDDAMVVESWPVLPAPVHSPGSHRKKARQLHGLMLRTFGLIAVVSVGLLGYWFAAGKPNVIAAGPLSRLLPARATPGASEAARVAVAPSAGESAASGDAEPAPHAADAPVGQPSQVKSAGQVDDLVSVCQRAVSPPEFLQCSNVGIAPAGAAGADRKFPFWVGAYSGLAEASGAVASSADGTVAFPATPIAGTANAAARERFESGLARLKVDDLERAVLDFSEAVRADPRFAEAYLLRGQTRFRNGDTERAIADFSKAIEVDPRQAAAYKARGMAMLYKGDDDAAIQDLTQAIQFAQLDRTRLPVIELFYARRSRAALYDRKRLYDSELAELNAMIDGYWKNTVLVSALRATYREQGSVSLMASIYRMRAGVHAKRGNLDGAIGDISFAMQLDPQRVLQLTLERARIQEAAGRRAQAAADFARVLELSPGNEDAQAGMARLKSRT